MNLRFFVNSFFSCYKKKQLTTIWSYCVDYGGIVIKKEETLINLKFIALTFLYTSFNFFSFVLTQLSPLLFYEKKETN
jgi:hypothetical protein